MISSTKFTFMDHILQRGRKFLLYKNAILYLSGDADFLQAIFFVLKYRPDLDLNLICLNNRILYKGLYYLSSYILSFSKNFKPDKKIARRAKIVLLKKTAELCPRLR